MKQWINDRALAAKVWWRDRKERAETRKAESVGAPAMEYGFDRTPRRIRFAVMLATWGVIGFLLLWITQITGVLKLDLAVDWALDRPFALDWDLQLDLNVLPLLVLGVVSFAIVFWSKAWVSLFASTPWHEWFSKWGALVLGIGGSMAIIMGGFEVNQNTREEDFRGALIQEQAAGQDRAALQSQIDQITADLNTAMNNPNAYLAQAASVGAMGGDWQNAYVEQARRTGDPRLPMLERAQGAADAAAGMVSRRDALREQLARSEPAAATEAVVTMTDPVSEFIGSIGAWRIVILVLVGDLILLLGNYFADKAEERARYATSAKASGWADEAHRIEDLRADEPVAAQPMKPPREVVRNAETGEEEIRIEPKPYWRKRKGKPQRVLTPVDGMQVQYEGETFTARDVVEKDGRSERLAADEAAHDSEVNQPIADADNHEANNEADKAPAPQADDSEPSIEPVHPEPSETAPADLDAINTLATLNSADEPEQHSTDDRADDAPAEEVSQPAIVADEADALAEDEDVFHDEPARETRPERLLAAAK